MIAAISHTNTITYCSLDNVNIWCNSPDSNDVQFIDILSSH